MTTAAIMQTQAATPVWMSVSRMVSTRTVAQPMMSTWIAQAKVPSRTRRSPKEVFEMS